MNEKELQKKELTLEEQYKLDCDRRLSNTVKILEEVAEEVMKGKEKEDFLKNLKGNKNG